MIDVLERSQTGAAPVARHPRGRAPRRRPPIALRLLAGLSGVVASLLVVALMLSDRAPGVVDRVFGDVATRLWERVDASGRAEFVTADRVPESDNLVHIGVWAIVMLLVGAAVWSWRWLLVAAPVVIGISAVIEVGQGRWADTRTVEGSDVMANSVGVALGVAAAATLYLLWSAAASLLRPSSTR